MQVALSDVNFTAASELHAYDFAVSATAGATNGGSSVGDSVDSGDSSDGGGGGGGGGSLGRITTCNM